MPVRDQRDVEHEQTDGREPERALSEPLARERAADDARQHVPAEPRGDERAAADDHHVRVREVADEVARVAGTREPLGGPRQVLDDHVQPAEQEEGAAREEVLGQPRVVRAELLGRVRLRPHRRLAARQQRRDRHHDHGEERRVGEELERREVLGVHLPSLLAQARLEEVDGQRPAEVERDHDREHDPGARHRRPAVPHSALTGVAVAEERACWDEDVVVSSAI